MSNTDHPTNDEEQFAAIPTDYRALLAMTRPLIVTEHGLAAWRGGEVCRAGFGMWPEAEDWRTEFTLRRGEIFHSDERGLGVAKDAERDKTTEGARTGRAPQVRDGAAESISGPRRRDSNLQIRICLGMS